MSWKSHLTAMFALTLVAAVLGCDEDPASPGPPDPISIAGTYDWMFDVSNDESGDDAFGCTGQGMATIMQPTDSTWQAGTAGEGTLDCVFFGEQEQLPTGEVAVGGELDGTDVAFQFPLPDVSEPCTAVGVVEDDPVTRLSGTATCTVDPSDFERQGDPFTLTGTWQADRTGN